ncbi:MAG: ABC transporter substrate-binding protein [Novosphingobium sp.]|nr:ABC transporter substrate-binding protein [Novosphingobium sp.]MCP5403279.1 ABC transporter substrate-binding protein [Novosphingobium sp.]
MREHLHIARTTLAVLAAAMLAACGKGDDSILNVVSIGSTDSPFEKGVYLSPPAQQVRAATVEGLVSLDGQGRVIPALADRWIVTDDGQSYIFRLRDGTWLDGRKVTAQSARAALRRSIAALRGTSLGFDLAGIDDIRVMAARVIEIRLAQPMPDLLQLLAQPELGLRHGGKGAGPMRLERDGATAVLTPIPPDELGLPAVDDWSDRIRTIRFMAFPAEAAVERFNRGEADLVLGGQMQDFPYSSSVGILRGTIKVDPVVGLFGLVAANDKGFLAAPENREAIAMAIDRDKLINPFGLSGWTPTTRLVSPGLDGDLGTIGERWAELSMDERRALATARVARWRQAQEEDVGVSLRVALPKGPGSDLLFRTLSEDLGKVGIETVLLSEEDDVDLRLIDDIARYPRAIWFLNRLNCKARRGLCSAEADQRVAESRKTGDPAERAALLAEAEAELTAANVYIPFGAPIRWSLVKGDVLGFAANRWGWHPLMPMAVRPK